MKIFFKKPSPISFSCKGLLVFALFSSMNGAMAQSNPHLTTSGTHFEPPVTDKNWSNSTGPDATKASFKSYSGKTYVLLKASQNTDIHLDCNAMLKKGTLKVIFSQTDEQDQLLLLDASSSGKASGTLRKRLNLQAGKEYRIEFIGDAAQGSYFCQWREITEE